MTDALHPPLNSADLRRFTPFETLNDEQLILIAGLAREEEVGEGARILAFDDDRSGQYFLLSGTVELEARDGMRQVVESGSEKARGALAPARPSDHGVIALSPARLLVLEQDLLEKLGRAGDVAPGEGSGPASALRENQVYQAIRADLDADRLVVPSLPEIALRIKKAVESETANIGKIARIVGADPAITAKLIKAANGPLYRGNATIDNCQAAIVRLGMNTTKQLVISFALRDLFRLDNPELKRRAQETWRHSTEVGAISMVLARLTDHLEPEQALLAGLLHDIGVVPILYQAQNDAALSADAAALDRAIAGLRGEVGALILRRWGLPEPLAQAARMADEWHYDSGARADYADLVILAQLHSHLKAGRGAEYPQMERLPACAKLAPEALTPQTSLRILDQAKGEVAEMIRLLT
ncbi:MAG: HDOD domain-containing protein [Gammaproteobacteria bacterium]|nr:HDOD domain-containing protein [Gammaproteobacteria bacterium]